MTSTSTQYTPVLPPDESPVGKPARSYYSQLEALFLGSIQFYKTDLTRIDQNALKDYSGPFVFGCYSHGTDLIRLNESLFTSFGKEELHSLKIKKAIALFKDSELTAFTIPNRLTRFAIGERGQVREVTQQEAIDFALTTFTALVEPFCLS